MTAIETLERKHASPAVPLDIVAIAVSNWGVVRSNPDYTIEELVKRGHRVLLVEPFETISSAFRMASIQRRKVDARYGLRKQAEGFWIYRPPPVAIPGQSRRPFAGRLSGRMLARLIRRQLVKLGMRADVLWSFMYNSGDCLAAFPEAVRIYENGDEDVALARTERQRSTVTMLDRETCKAADLVFAVTEELCAPRRSANPATHEVNCGVDPDFFRQALAEKTSPAEKIARIPSPVIGYFGGLDPWKIDIDLITEIARRRPDWSFVFVGYVWFDFDGSVFSGLPNIHVLGPQPYDQIPSFLAGFDVGLMPFPLNDITRNGDALKCYEYLAAGLPVVGRDVPVARRLPEFVRIADTAEEFVTAIEAALSDDRHTAESRSTAMLAHSWSARVEQKLDLIEGARGK